MPNNEGYKQGSAEKNRGQGFKDGRVDPNQVDIQENKRAVKKVEKQSEPLDIRRVKEDYRITNSDRVVVVDASPAAVTITLPKAATMINRTLEFKKIDSTANAMKIESNFPEQIDGAASVSTTTQYAIFRLKADAKGKCWLVL